MVNVSAGHVYKLANDQEIRFMKNMPDEGYSGTTNEEVLEMMLDRMKYLNGVMPCRENSIVITKLQEALMWLNERTKDRQARGVEGTQKP